MTCSHRQPQTLCAKWRWDGKCRSEKSQLVCISVSAAFSGRNMCRSSLPPQWDTPRERGGADADNNNNNNSQGLELILKMSAPLQSAAAVWSNPNPQGEEMTQYSAPWLWVSAQRSIRTRHGFHSSAVSVYKDWLDSTALKTFLQNISKT